jgi:hypothetical protein
MPIWNLMEFRRKTVLAIAKYSRKTYLKLTPSSRRLRKLISKPMKKERRELSSEMVEFPSLRRTINVYRTKRRLELKVGSKKIRLTRGPRSRQHYPPV